MSVAPAGWNEQTAYWVSERAYLLHTEGHSRESLALFEGLMEIDPGNVYYKDAASALHLALNNPGEAIHYASEVLSLEPENASARVRRCEGYLLLRMYREAEQDLQDLRRSNATAQVRRMEMRLLTAKRTLSASMSSMIQKINE